MAKRPKKPDVMETDMIVHLPLACAQKHPTEYSSSIFLQSRKFSVYFEIFKMKPVEHYVYTFAQ